VGTAVTGGWAWPGVHWEIVARDPERLAGFYRRLFNWDIGEEPGDDRPRRPGWP
jgi:predicted enzyme related to lactoylglutathione lyase